MFRTYFTVIDSVENPDGKWPDSLGNVVVMEVNKQVDLNR